MKILAIVLILYSGFTQYTGVVGVAVGLYAPDRYDGIPDMCLMPMDFGYCRAKVKRYYFDMRRMKCTMFYWGGCAGNINNFKSPDECNKLCLDAFEANRGSLAVNLSSRERPTAYYPSRNGNTSNNNNGNTNNNSIQNSNNYNNNKRSASININISTPKSNNNSVAKNNSHSNNNNNSNVFKAYKINSKDNSSIDRNYDRNN